MSEVIFRGYLYKSPPESFTNTLKPWRQRWVVLLDSRQAFPFAQPYVRLEYYINQQLAEDLDEPKGVIDLKDCTEVVDRHRIRGYDHVFDICTEKRSYHFAAPSLESKGIWIESIQSVLRSKDKPPGSPSVTPRLGLKVAEDASVASPMYQAVSLPSQHSNKTHQTPPPARNATLPNRFSLDEYQHLSHKKSESVPALVRTGPSSLYDTLSTEHSSQDDYHRLDHNMTNVRISTTSVASPSHYSHLQSSTNGSDNDDYNHLSHVLKSSESEIRHPSPNTSQYSSLTVKGDYQHLKHKTNDTDRSKHLTSNSSHYSSLAMQDDYQRLSHKKTSNNVGTRDNHDTSLTSQYSTLAIEDDDYQHLSNATTNGTHRTSAAAFPESMYSVLGPTQTYSNVTHNSSNKY